VHGSLLVVRKDGPKGWAAWRVTPANASQTRICALPFRPLSATVSPSGARVAYLPWELGPRIAIVDVRSGAARLIAFSGLGVRSVGEITWTSNTDLLVTANSSENIFSETDRLYAVSAETGRVSPFRGIVGTEPDAAPRADRLVYVTLQTVEPPHQGAWVEREQVITVPLRRAEDRPRHRSNCNSTT
jgi:hypothetical protein